VAGPIARLKRVSYWYPNADEPSLQDVNLEIRAGLTLVAGGSGGGKSTLLRVLNGLVPQFHGGRISGSAVVAELDPFRTPIPRMARRVGLVFQDVETQSVYGTVEREIAFGLENAATPRAKMHDRVDAVMAELAIGHLRGRRLATLSGGERQRVQLAAVLVMRPVLVALDEPTSQLDPDGAAAALEACRCLAVDGRAVVVAEHRLEPLLGAADELLLVEDGRVGATSADALRTPAGPGSRGARAVFAETAWELSDVTAGPAGSAGPTVLEGVSLAGGVGEVVALVGANGSGKTTLLRTLAGLVPPLAGTVRRPAGRTAYLPQNPGALLHLPTVRAEVELTLSRSGSTESTAEMLAAFGLSALADQYPRDLSSGQRQRAALAATLAGSPALVLLDEPTRGMDAAARRSLVSAVRRLTERGSAVVVATHDTDLATELADRTIVIGDGRAWEPAVPEPSPAAEPSPAPESGHSPEPGPSPETAVPEPSPATPRSHAVEPGHSPETAVPEPSPATPRSHAVEPGHSPEPRR
jgi:energy-coupling factor transporter ATP-binding protein EcfA2